MDISKYERVAEMATDPTMPHRRRKYLLDIPRAMDEQERHVIKHATAWLAHYGLLGKKEIEIRFSDENPTNPDSIQIELDRELCHKNMLDAEAEARRLIVTLVATGAVARQSDVRKQQKEREEREHAEAAARGKDVRKRIKLRCSCPPPDNYVWDDEVGEGMTLECRKCGSWFVP